MNWICPKCGREFSRQDQDHYCVKPQNIDEYIAAQDETVQPRLSEVREILHAAIPDAEERISLSMPTYWKGKNIIHFAASKKHLGLYPGGEATTDHMIAFCWEDNWIILDVFHGMTDGTGAYEVVRTLLYYYCSERYGVKLNDEGIRLAGDEISAEEWDDPVANRADLPSPRRNDQMTDALNLIASAGLEEKLLSN